MSIRFPILLVLCLALMPAAPAVPAPAPTVLVLGDSLSAGYGLDAGQGWVALLEQKLRDQGMKHTVVNASVSGETTAGGLARLPALLERHRPAVVLVELGGNDGLRALPLDQLRKNLLAIADACAARGARAVLFEMRIPANYGPLYAERFHRVFGEVAAARGLPLAPFLLGDFAEDPSAFQDDGIHPGPGAQPRMLRTVWPALRAALQH